MGFSILIKNKNNKRIFSLLCPEVSFPNPTIPIFTLYNPIVSFLNQIYQYLLPTTLASFPIQLCHINSQLS